jgi:hypothetical protein
MAFHFGPNRHFELTDPTTCQSRSGDDWVGSGLLLVAGHGGSAATRTLRESGRGLVERQ